MTAVVKTSEGDAEVIRGLAGSNVSHDALLVTTVVETAQQKPNRLALGSGVRLYTGDEILTPFVERFGASRIQKTTRQPQCDYDSQSFHTSLQIKRDLNGPHCLSESVGRTIGSNVFRNNFPIVEIRYICIRISSKFSLL